MCMRVEGSSYLFALLEDIIFRDRIQLLVPELTLVRRRRRHRAALPVQAAGCGRRRLLLAEPSLPAQLLESLIKVLLLQRSRAARKRRRRRRRWGSPARAGTSFARETRQQCLRHAHGRQIHGGRRYRRGRSCRNRRRAERGGLEVGGGVERQLFPKELRRHGGAEGEGVAALRGQIRHLLRVADGRHEHPRLGVAGLIVGNGLHLPDQAHAIPARIPEAAEIRRNVLRPHGARREHLVRRVAGRHAQAAAQLRGGGHALLGEWELHHEGAALPTDGRQILAALHQRLRGAAPGLRHEHLHAVVLDARVVQPPHRLQVARQAGPLENERVRGHAVEHARRQPASVLGHVRRVQEVLGPARARGSPGCLWLGTQREAATPRCRQGQRQRQARDAGHGHCSLAGATGGLPAVLAFAAAAAAAAARGAGSGRA
mmetsp:Transcript_10196/g.30390  ORF Transcript_10196/g.30390 Transcript_10196/m.30390 type:complete len:430 (+) Transcript_10196:1637-2926(+)